MSLKNNLFIALNIILAVLFLLAWPVNIKPFSFTVANQKDEKVKYAEIREGETFVQEFPRKGEYLESIELLIKDIAPEQTGNIRITLCDGQGSLLAEQKIPLAELINDTFNKVSVKKNLEEDADYFLEIASDGCGEDQFSLGIFEKEKEKQEAVVIYHYRNTMNRIRTLMWWLLLGIIWLLLVKLFFDSSADKIKQTLSSPGTIAQAAVVIGIIACFCLASALSPAVKAEKSLRTLWHVFLIWGILIWLLRLLKNRVEWKNYMPKTAYRKYMPVIFVLFINAIVRIPMIGTMQRWDAGEYYYRLGTACENYDFTIQSIFDNFRLCTHSNLGFSLIMAIGEFLNPRGIAGVQVMTLILTLLAVYCIYCLIKDWWLRCGPWLAAGFTLPISFTPIFLGTFAYVNTDYQLALYFIFLLFAEFKGWHILSWLAAVLVSQCKETGVLIILGYYGFRILSDLFHEKGNVIRRLLLLFRKSSVWIALMTGAVYAATVLKVGRLATWVQNADAESSLSWSNSEINCFGFRPDYIIHCIKQYFILNFAWLITGAILCCILIILLKKQHCSVQRYTGFIGAMLGFFIFGLVYITGGLNRYNVPFVIGWSIAGMIIYYYAIGRSVSGRANICFILLLSIAFFVQSFWNIDMISSAIFRKAAISDKNSILFTSYEYGNAPYYGDGLVNNYQYSWTDRALDAFLRKIHYSRGMTILLPREENAGLHINGNGNVYTAVWNQEKQKRTMRGAAPDDETVIHTLSEPSLFGSLPLKYTKEMISADELPENVYIPFLKYYDVDKQKILSETDTFYYAGESGSVSSYGGTIEYCHRVKKDEYEGCHIWDVINKDSGKTFFKDSMDDTFMAQILNQITVDEDLAEALAYKKYKKEYKEEASKRNVIQRYDVVKADMRIRDRSGKYLGLGYVGNYDNSDYTFELGQGKYLDEIEDALIGKELGGTVKITCAIPEEYLPAPEYQGQELDFYITPFAILKKAVIDPNSIDRLKKEARRELENEQIKEASMSLAYHMDYDSLGYSVQRLQKEITKVERYYKKYLISSGISRQSFITDYLQTDEKAYQQALEETAKLSLKKKYICRKILSCKNRQI